MKTNNSEYKFSLAWAAKKAVWEVGGQTWNLWNLLQKFFPKFSILPEKMRKSWHFRPKIENERWSTHTFQTNCQLLCNYLLLYKPSFLFFENSNQILANFTDGVTFCANSWKFYRSPKFFFLSASCATFYKFHVWRWAVPCAAFSPHEILDFTQYGLKMLLLKIKTMFSI